MGRRRAATVAEVVALVVCGTACGGDDSSEGSNSTSTSVSNTASTTAEGATGTSASSSTSGSTSGATTSGTGGMTSSSALTSATNGGGAGESGAGGAGGANADCGNGTVDPGEACDDGNSQDGDGCSVSCEVVCSDHDADAVLGPTGSCYLSEADADATHSAAVASCEAIDAHLVTVTSESEQLYVADLAAFTWMGASDGLDPFTSETADYIWVTGEAFEYENWGDTQPNNTPHDCRPEVGTGTCYEHCLLKEEAGGWNDVDCTFPNPYVCEWDAPGR